MPYDTTGSNNNNMPAIWFLNGQVVRTDQWGCNCRGMGAAGGCGELDVAEVIPNLSVDACTSTLYSFKQSLGAGFNNYFSRPVNSSSVFVVVFDARGSGNITILQQNYFPYTETIPQDEVSGWIANTSPMTVVVLGDPYVGPSCTGLAADVSDEAATHEGTLSVGANVGVALGVVVVGLVVTAVVVIRLKRKWEERV